MWKHTRMQQRVLWPNTCCTARPIICCLHTSPPTRSQVRTLFGTQSLEMWAVGAAGAYRLHLPRLYGRVLPHKCRVKVNQVCRLLCLFRFTVVHVPAVLPPPPPLPHPLLPPLTPQPAHPPALLCAVQKARKVYLLLHKESDAEWCFLKS